MAVLTITLNPCVDRTFAVERLVADHKLDVRDVEDYPGGGGLNVARVITRLDGEALALWGCGGDQGRQLASLLEAEGVNQASVPLDGVTRQNPIVTDRSSGQQFRFNMPGPTLSAGDRDRWREEIEERAAAADYVVFSGSLPEGASPAWYGELIRRLPKEARAIVDTKRQALSEALDVGVYLVKPNARELEDLLGRELDDEEALEAAAREIVARGAENVLVSVGKGGALLADSEGVERIVAPSVRARSKVGAGDSMVGGLVAALDRGLSLREAARWGVAAGAAAVMTEGTELCHREDVERLLKSAGTG